MYHDPVVEEMRENGARIAEDCGGDIHRMAERFRHEQARNTARLICHQNRPLTPRGNEADPLTDPH